MTTTERTFYEAMYRALCLMTEALKRYLDASK